MDSLSFDPIAQVYDETRIVNEACLKDVLDLVAGKFPPSKYQKLLEPGIGTGRIGISLAEKGYHVTGIDISDRMLELLADKLKRRNNNLPLVFQKADVTDLPFPEATFDIAVVVHVFHLVRNWQKAVAEVFRALKPGSPVVSLTTGAGLEIPAINERYRAICAECGHPAKPLGLPGFPEFKEYLRSSGSEFEYIENRWRWTKQVHVGNAFRHIKSRHYGMTYLVPEEVHLRVVDILESELCQQYGSLDTTVEVPNQMRVLIISG